MNICIMSSRIHVANWENGKRGGNPLQNFGKRRFLKPSLPFVNLQTKIKALQSCLGPDFGELCEPKGRSSKVVFA